MNKRGQLTIFIIIAILIVAIVALYFIFRGERDKGVDSGDVNALVVVNFIEGCLEESGKEALYLVGLRGGYIDSPPASTNVGVPFYLFEGSPNIPSKELIEEELSKSVESLIPLCFEGMDLDEEFIGLEVEIARDPKVETSIEEDNVYFELNYPVKVTKGESSSVVQDFDERVYVRLSGLYVASEFIVRDYLANSMNLCISCLLDYGYENDILVEMENQNDVVVFELADNRSDFSFPGDVFDDGNYKFKFAVKF